MESKILMKNHSIPLNLLRGLAAILVCVGHIRAFFLIDFSETHANSLLVYPIYIVSSFGHQAVIIFFALSGYLVGGPTLVRIISGSFKALSYSVTRIVRLWMVVVPGLIITLIMDSMGRRFSASAYSGNYSSILSSGPDVAHPYSGSFSTFVGNLFFLQTIRVPIFGSNYPLWSLANEAVYYLLFPTLLLGLFMRPNRPGKYILLAASIGMMFFIPNSILLLGICWISGAAIFYVARLTGISRRHNMRMCGLLLLVPIWMMGLLLSYSIPSLVSDIIFGVCTAFVLPLIHYIPVRSKAITHFSTVTSDISYTLYVYHFPIVMFIWSTLFSPKQFQPNITGLMVCLCTFGLVLTISFVFWFIFERRTIEIRSFILARFNNSW